jgi:hypothetical protein
MDVTCCAAQLNDDVFVVAQDWGSHAFAREAAKLAAIMLKPGSGYAGKRDLDSVSDFIAGLLEIPPDKPYGCCLMLARVIDKMPSS